jgi:ATP-dependent DNA helicase RecQ
MSTHSTSSPETIDIAQAARKLLKFPSLRPGQEEAIRSLLEGRDTLLVQPTGSGKSAVYQIAGALREGSTIVVSPLIALQKDQSEAIEASRLDETAVVNSTLSASEMRDALERIEAGKVEYIFLAPEQLSKEETLDRLRAANVSLIAIDEAHCISQWGHDLRPDYLGLKRVIESLGHPPVIAMTATASNEVRREISERLGLRNPRVLVYGFDRPNISLRVDTFSTKAEKHQAVLRRVEFADKPGIVYVSTHKNAESIAADLQSCGVNALFYHGGLKAKQRDEIQDRFMNGDVDVIVATNAFGMGVDKPDIRFVYHADVSESLDGYYQEIGRAGRDGEPAEAVLFYRPQDINAQQYKTGGGNVDTRALELVASTLASKRKPASREDLARETALNGRKLSNIVHKLEEVGAARQLDSGKLQIAKGRTIDDIAEAAASQQQVQKDVRKKRLECMQGYAERRTCRREYLLRYFGVEDAGPCGNCDRCEMAGIRPKKVA